MAIKILPFGAFGGFSDLARPGTHYYSQGLTESLFGTSTLYRIDNKRDSNTVTIMGNIRNFANASGIVWAQDDNGNLLKELTPGNYDFAVDRSPGGNGAGLVGDQKGRLLYCQNSALGMRTTGGAYTDSWKSFSTTGQHPGDTYEDLVVFCDGPGIACLFSDDSWNNTAFTIPSGMTAVAVKGGKNGILLGANFGYRGVLILWDGTSPRSKTPWTWTKGQILSIENTDQGWLVKTQRETLLTNGYTTKRLFGVFDDALSLTKSYENANVLPQQTCVVGDILVFINTSRANGPLMYEYGRMKPGVYLYHMPSGAWDYVPLGTGNMIHVDVYSVFADVNYNNRILIGYRDLTLGVNYIATLLIGTPPRAMYVSEILGEGRPHGSRAYLGPTEKVAENLLLNLTILNSITDPATNTFNVTLKLYNFKRQLWGAQVTNAALGSSHKNEVQVNGSNTAFAKAQAGDEVTILDGVNAGQIAHIESINNGGTSTETWILDTTFANATESGIHLSVQPFKLIKKLAFSALLELPTIFFDIKAASRGKQFLAKIVIDGLGTNLQVELQPSYFIFDDLGYDQT
jgi:hypothetical protein